MKKIVIIIVSLIIIGCAIYFILNLKNLKKEKINEYNPAEEITDEQLARTMVTLYFKNKDNNMLVPEPRLIDSKLLIINPYEELVKLLISGPKNDALATVIPEGTKINKIEISGDTVNIDFSKEFIENHTGGLEEENKTIHSIVNTLTELIEVNGVNILIEGERDKEFTDGLVNFKNTFFRI